MFACGLAKFGWLNTLVASIRNCTRARSLMRKYFIAEKSKFTSFGPRRMFTPELPNRPTGAGLVQTGFVLGHPGMAKALVSNQFVMDWPDDSTPLPMRSGRAMKALLGLGPKLLVLDGSKPP